MFFCVCVCAHNILKTNTLFIILSRFLLVNSEGRGGRIVHSLHVVSTQYRFAELNQMLYMPETEWWSDGVTTKAACSLGEVSESLVESSVLTFPIFNNKGIFDLL